MNILFFTTYQLSLTKGGTERITLSLANILRSRYGYKCYSAYIVPDKIDKHEYLDGSFCLPRRYGKAWRKQLYRFVTDHRISIIINQGGFDMQPRFANCLKGIDVKYILVHHFEPGWEEHFITFRKTIFKLLHSPRLLSSCRALLHLMVYPLFKMHYNASIPNQYRRGYESTYRMVLLSEGFCRQFLDYAHITDERKIRFIPNMLSYTDFLPKTEIACKEKMVLVVCRLDEEQKRISHALRIWQLIERCKESAHWTLHIIGHGPEERRYHRLACQLGLQRVTFHGRQNPKPYYRRASLFMMTSRSEGWGLTLTESQQMGVVPLAYDSYNSLHDIITDGYNGFIIPNADMEAYASRMLELMCNEELRRKIASQAIDSAHRFEPAKVAEKWIEVIKE